MAIEQASYGNRIGRRPARLCLVVPTLGAALVIVGCGGNTVTAGDAGPDTTADGATDTGVAHDRPQPDVADAPALDAPAGDGPALDGPAGDVPNDAAREDLGTPLDGGRCDPEGPADGLVTDPACRAEMATAPTCEGAGPCPITAYRDARVQRVGRLWALGGSDGGGGWGVGAVQHQRGRVSGAGV